MSAIDRPLFPGDDEGYSWDTIGSNPERAGLEIVGTLDAAIGYEFDTLIVFRDIESRDLYYAADSGCSCPTPFEGFTRLSDLTRIDPHHLDAFEQAVHSWNDEYGPKVGSGEVARLLREVRDAISAPA